MSRFVRASKVRHVYCQPTKHELCYQTIQLSSATGTNPSHHIYDPGIGGRRVNAPRPRAREAVRQPRLALPSL